MGSGADSPYQGEMARRARGGRVGDYEHEVLIRSRPRWRFGYFAAVGKVTRRPQTAESPCKKNPTAGAAKLPKKQFKWYCYEAVFSNSKLQLAAGAL